MPAFEEAGVAVYTLSYDEPDALRDFRDAHGITYELLSDPDSAVIRQFGILNTLINEDDHPWFGIPYPGSYVMDGAGQITHKFFDSNLAVRAGPEQLLAAALGREYESDAQTEAPEKLEVSVFLEGDHVASTVQRDLVVRFNVPDGRHVYANPAPAGSVAADIVLDDNPSLVRRDVQMPPSIEHTLSGTGERFQVYEGLFDLRVPITVNSQKRARADEIVISGEIRWQTCDDEVCDIP